jgi:hypothetical protein
MNLTNDKEIDLLLSRLARRKETRVPGEFGGGAGDGGGGDNGTPSFTGNAEHLDADELNAYAENALLPGARTRYTAHLADCETCRKTVADLTLAGGVALALEKSESTSPQDISLERSWWKNFFALFSLPVVRYGVPALALLAIISVAFIATRQRGADRALVAQNKETSPVSAVKREEEEENHPQAPLASTTSNANASNNETTQSGTLNPATGANNNLGQSSNRPLNKNEADSPKGTAAVKEESPQESTETDVARNDAPPVAGPPVALSKPGYATAQPEAADKSETVKDNPAQAGKEVASEPAPQQSQDAFEDRRSATGSARSAEQQRQQQQARSMDRGRDMTIDGADDNTYGVRNNQKKMPAPAATSAARRRGGGPAKTESKVERESAPADESAGEKRSVAGRTFRRQGNAWVDTAYDSSRATVNVARGSEQYRSLLADEPSLRTIAEQLGGEVVVVWKGRAYRIH